LTTQLYQFGVDTSSLGLGAGEVVKARKTVITCAVAVNPMTGQPSWLRQQN
jgi:hypothetical protein